MDLVGIERLLQSLNAYQRAAVEVGPGRAAVCGGPGGGKTKTLVARLARLARDGYDLRWCLAMTFTRFAAKEINDRLSALGLETGRVGTIHSVCNEILNGPGADLVSGLKIDESGWKLQMILKRCLSADKFKRYSYDLEGIEAFVGACKATGVVPVFGNPFGMNMDGYKRVEKLAEEWDRKTGLPSWALAEVYDDFEKHRAGNMLYSFDEMENWAWQLMLVRPDILSWLHARWQLVMIDEAQDSDPVQWDMTYLLARMGSKLTDRVKPGSKTEQNLMALGDVSQSLYSWKSATPEWFQEFATSEDTGLFVLPVNYRSVPEICRLGSGLVKGEEWHLGGEMQWGGAQAPEALALKPFGLQCFEEIGLEAQWVVKEAKRMHELFGYWRSTAILARLSSFLNLVEIECIREGIPYEKRCSGTFAGGKEVTGLVAYLRVAGGWDPEGKWERMIVNTPFRYIGKQALYAADLAHGSGPGYIETLMTKGGLSLRQRRSMEDLDQLMRVLAVRVAKGHKPKELVQSILKWTDFEESLRKDRGGLSLDTAKLASVQQVEWLAGLFETTAEFVVFMDQLNEGVKLGRKRLQVKDQAQDALVLSTIHQMKGLEAPVVYLCDVVQGRHPWNRAHSLDEELRLAYVALTRAKYHCTVSYSGHEGEDLESFIITRLKKLTSSPDDLTARGNDEENAVKTSDSPETPRNVTIASEIQ